MSNKLFLNDRKEEEKNPGVLFKRGEFRL